MGEEFGKSGLFIDDLYALRVIDPQVANETNELKEECEQFTDKLAEFRRIIDQFANIIETFAVEVDQEKMRAVGVQNMLKTFSKQRESEQQQIQSEIIEKMVELDKLKIEYQYLQRIESEQQEMIDAFYQHQ
ncbi:intraflagellar transport protein 20 homolog [Anopheles aquasalis]|uniref:intraflagellar transport protein 20 homolog n=1 Tax=Anopheles aquasalis TaxID=42839 RepID=UPI00215B0A9A|nr:intraflagellar transport protein 20 homolog [Anopheles aquasalis]